MGRDNIIVEDGTFTDESLDLMTEEISGVKNKKKTIDTTFDKVINYEKYIKNNNVGITENKKINTTTYIDRTSDLNPTNTTMQFQNLKNAEAYSDYKPAEEEYVKNKNSQARTKIFIVSCAVVVAVLMTLTIFNSILLKKMNEVISRKTEQVAQLQEQNNQLVSEIDYAKSPENIARALEEILGK